MSTNLVWSPGIHKGSAVPSSRMGKTTGNKPKLLKCEIDIGVDINGIPLMMYEHVNPSESERK